MVRQGISGKAFLSVGLGCALLQAAFAENPDEGRVRFMERITQQSGNDLQSYMKDTKLTPQELARRRLPTPAQMAQYTSYDGQAKDSSSAPSLAGGDAEAREAVVKAAELSVKAAADAKDTPRKYVAETGKEVVSILAELYNSVFVGVNKKINDIQQKMDTVVAIAVVLNAGNSTTQAAANTPPAQQGQQIQQIRATYIDQGEVTIGQALQALTARELPLARYGKGLREDGVDQAKSIPKIIETASAALDAARAKTQALAKKEKEYRHGMKGRDEGSSAWVLNNAIDRMGAQMINLKLSSEQYLAFLNGPGKAIEKVLDCSQATYDFGVILQRDLPQAPKLASGNRAVEANLAATQAAKYAAQEKMAVAWLKSQSMPTGEIAPPGYDKMAAPKAGMSKAGDEKAGKNAEKRARELVNQ